MKKIIALVLALAMILLVGAVYAEDMSSEFTGGAFSQTPEGSIQVQNLGENDNASYYQLVSWNTADGVWQLTTLGTTAGVSLENLVDGITSAEAASIATALKDATATGSFSGTGTTRTANVDPGLYYVKATPGSENTDTVYNPAFVSADYYAGGNIVDFSTAIAAATVLKKSTIEFDKDVVGADKYIDTKPGDKIPYQITTQIPSYGASFTHPVFTVTDTLSTGLTLYGDVSVTYGTSTVTASNGDVTITKGTPTNGFTVNFTEAYLTGLNGAMPSVTITYTGEVTTEALQNVTYLDNKAHLEFSNSPSTTADKDDITRHYTFSIDASIQGGEHGNERSRELIKIGVDPTTGETITAFTSWVDGEEWTSYAPLAGAEFSLVGEGITRTATSTAEGYISFYGLDAGTYTLTETSAPGGYVRDTAEHTVVITPTYSTTDPDVLVSYTITIDGAESAYTITNMNDTNATVETTVDNSSVTWPFINTRGTELPSTGGIGTTIFYILGGLLVVGAAVILVARRKAQD